MLKKKKELFDFLFPAAILLAATILFWIFPLDVKLQSFFFSSDNGWYLSNSAPWYFLYHYSNVPALILSVGSLILLGISFWKESLIRYRKIFLFFVLVMAIGPGLIINTILKDNWGRPRPRNIVEFNGNYKYEKPLGIDASSKGKSFPCGHASMGFYLLTPFFLLRKKKIKAAYIFLFLGLITGFAIGIARMVQGGHFASDVIWAGSLVYLTAAGIFYLLKLNEDIFFKTDKQTSSRKKATLILIIGLAVIALIMLLMLATPYSYKKEIDLSNSENLNEIVLITYRADVIFQHAESTKIEIEATGHGFPWSKLKTRIKEAENGILMKQRESGYFSEIDQQITIYTSDSIDVDFVIDIEQGNLIIPDSLQLDRSRILKR